MPSGITITLDTITPLLRETRTKFRGTALMRLLAGEAANETRRFFTEINDRYSPTSRFYTKEGGNVVKTGTVTANSATITIGSYKMAHKLYGGTVFATRTKYLAIPLTESAKLRTPRQYGGGSHSPLFFVQSKHAETGVLFDSRTKQPAYALKTRVTHRGFKDRAMPSEQRLLQAMTKTLQSYLK